MLCVSSSFPSCPVRPIKWNTPTDMDNTNTPSDHISQMELACAASLVKTLSVNATQSVMIAVERVIICFDKSAAKSYDFLILSFFVIS